MSADEKAEFVARVRARDAAGVEELLSANAAAATDLANAVDRVGVSALGHAARIGDADLVARLLKAGADPNKTSDAGNSPLMEAAARGHLEVMRALLDAGAEPEAKNKWGFAAADWADWPVNGAEVRALLQQHTS